MSTISFPSVSNMLNAILKPACGSAKNDKKRCKRKKILKIILKLKAKLYATLAAIHIWIQHLQIIRKKKRWTITSKRDAIYLYLTLLNVSSTLLFSANLCYQMYFQLHQKSSLWTEVRKVSMTGKINLPAPFCLFDMSIQCFNI